MRRLSRTPKNTPEDKFRVEINRLIRRSLYPLKMYYSQARMVNPTAEYHGRDYPLPILVGVLDIDKEGLHKIDSRNYVQNLKTDLKERTSLVIETLREVGYRTRPLFSGKRGFIFIFVMMNWSIDSMKSKEY